MARLHKLWETRPSGVYLSALERVYNARLSFLRERELCLGNFTALTPRWNSSLSCLQNVSGRGRKAIFNAGRELSCRSSLYLTYPPRLNSLPAFPSSRLATFAFVLGGFNNRLTAITISRGPPQLNYAESIVSQRFAFSSYQPLCIFLVFCIFPICDPPPCCLSSPLEGVL